MIERYKSKFRDPDLAKNISEKIIKVASTQKHIKICHVCGTHEWTITHFGLRSLLPENIEVIAGPGCPVCIVPASEIDEAIKLAMMGVVVTCFGDVLRVRGSDKSLLEAKAEGSDVRFETTAPSTGVEILKDPPKNFSFLISHRVIPPAMKVLVEMPDLELDGFIAPGHVSTIIGVKSYKIFPEKYNIPTVIAGFEPLDILFGIYMILKQLKKGKPRIENEYKMAVTWDGNIKAQKVMESVFNKIDGKWRGIGTIPASKYKLKKTYYDFDVFSKYDVKVESSVDFQPGCKCHLVIIGKIKPNQCPLFMKKCTPQNPIGACMVSVEGTCRIWSKNITIKRVH